LVAGNRVLQAENLHSETKIEHLNLQDGRNQLATQAHELEEKIAYLGVEIQKPLKTRISEELSKCIIGVDAAVEKAIPAGE